MIIERKDQNEQIQQQIIDLIKVDEIKRQIDKIISQEERYVTVVINLDLMRENCPELERVCRNKPIEASRMFETSIVEFMKGMNRDVTGLNQKNWRVSFEGNLGNQTITPRGLKSRLVNKLVKLQGIVISVSKVRHRLLQSTHYCETTDEFSTYVYKDLLDLRQNKAENADFRNNVPLADQNNEAISMEYGFSVYKDYQVAIVQEMPEHIPTGLMSRSVEVTLQEDLVDSVKPGDRAQITGIFRPTIGGAKVTGIFRPSLMATSVNLLQAAGEVNLTSTEIKRFKALAKRDDLLPLLVRSMAPSICGNDCIKEGLLLQLIGGTEKVFEGGMRLRGDLNVLLIGDPSTGKSQFLRRVMNIANLSFSTTGRGSTGVGLTAAIVVDKDTNERVLEAGAMVLADRGVICVDEFDKMSVEDRVAMHEVMEQQTVTIAKAGIHVSLNARCSVLAAANPRYGEYFESASMERNINMPPSLLSRFDLIYVVRDLKDPAVDKRISERVTKNHRFEGSVSNVLSMNDTSGILPPEADFRKADDLEEFEQFNKYLHEDKTKAYLKVDFLKKYIIYAKQVTPELTDETNDVICRKWAKLRKIDEEYASNGGNRIIVQTIRSLESIIRLATAYAKLRLSRKVEVLDVLNAFTLFNSTFYGDKNNKLNGFLDDIHMSCELYERFRNMRPNDLPFLKTLVSNPPRSALKVEKTKERKCAEENIDNNRAQEVVPVVALKLLSIKDQRVKEVLLGIQNLINGEKTKTIKIDKAFQAIQKKHHELLEEEFRRICDLGFSYGKFQIDSDQLFNL